MQALLTNRSHGLDSAFRLPLHCAATSSLSAACSSAASTCSRSCSAGRVIGGANRVAEMQLHPASGRLGHRCSLTVRVGSSSRTPQLCPPLRPSHSPVRCAAARIVHRVYVHATHTLNHCAGPAWVYERSPSTQTPGCGSGAQLKSWPSYMAIAAPRRGLVCYRPVEVS